MKTVVFLDFLDYKFFKLKKKQLQNHKTKNI